MTMAFQAHDGLNAHSEELHRHILRSHLAYLNQEETPSKLKQRHNLESLIAEFLNSVSHCVKFTFFEVAKILNDSIESNENFSAYKAGSAFEALEKYATNLISHPWRKEYKTIKLYSGFYKHSVECQLFGGSSVFHLLGYQFTENGVLFLDEPVDPDKVARVALDCLIAYVECQVMVQICERVKAFKCSWFEINQVRQDYVCSIDEAVRIIQQLKRNALDEERHDKWLREQENGSMSEEKSFSKSQTGSSYQKTGILVDVSNTWPSSNSYTGYNSSSLVLQPTVCGGYAPKLHKQQLTDSKLPAWSGDVPSHLPDYSSQGFLSKSDEADGYNNSSGYSFLTKNNSLGSRYVDSDSTPDTWKDSWDILRSYPEHQANSYLHCDRESARTSYSNSVPNVKETFSTQFGHIYPSNPMLPLGLPAYPLHHEFNIPSGPCQCQMCCDHQLSMLPHKYHFPRDASSNNFESLRKPSRADSNHVEDPDELCSSLFKLSMDTPNPPTKTRHFPVPSTYSSYQTSAPGDVLLRPNAGNKSSSKRGSYYDNVPTPFDGEVNTSLNLTGQSLPLKCDFQTNGILPSSKSKSQKEAESAVSISVSSTLSSKPLLKKSYSSSSSNPTSEQLSSTIHPNISDSKNEKISSGIKDSKGDKKWSCGSCTFYNAAEKNICDMCGRSKLPGPEITPLVSGGRECPQCTLVNKKDCEDCTACGASLKDSPTYI